MAKTLSWMLLFLVTGIQLCLEVQLCLTWSYGFGASNSLEMQEGNLEEQRQETVAGPRAANCTPRDCLEILLILFLLAVVTFAWNAFCYFRIRHRLHRRDLQDEDTFNQSLGRIQLNVPPPQHRRSPPPPYIVSEGHPPPYTADPPPAYEEIQLRSNFGDPQSNGNRPGQYPRPCYIRSRIQFHGNQDNRALLWFLLERAGPDNVSASDFESTSDSDTNLDFNLDSDSDSEY